MPKIVGLLIILTLIVLPPSELKSQTQIEKWSSRNSHVGPYETEIKQGIDYVYNLEFEKAEQIFSKIKKNDPKSPVGFFFDGMVLWWKIMLDLQSTTHDDLFFEKMEKVIEVCDERLERNSEDAEALFFKSGALGFRGRLRANRGSWLKAAGDGKDALPIVKKLMKLNSDNYDLLFGLALYNYYAEVIPERNPILKPVALFFPKGDKKKGIEQLQITIQKGNYAKTEALYFLLQIYYVYENDFINAASCAYQLHEKYPNNSFFYAYLGRTYAASGYWRKSMDIYSDIAGKCKENAPHYTKYYEREAHFYLGMGLMSEKKYQAALEHFKVADQLSKTVDNEDNSAYQTLIVLRMGMIYDVTGSRSQAVSHYKKVLEMKDYKDAHTAARNYLDHPYSG